MPGKGGVWAARPVACGLLLTVPLIALPVRTSAADSPQSTTRRATTAPSTPEESLWLRIVAADALPASASQPTEWFAIARARRKELLAHAQLYQTLYPGGAHRDEVVRMELNALFELGSLGDSFDPLVERVRELLGQPPSEAALHEAAYWNILCDHLKGASAPRPDIAIESDPHLLAAYRDYLDKYPRSRHAPRLATLVFEDALERDDRTAMRAMVELLNTQFPRHAATASLAAQLRREESVGKMFHVKHVCADGTQIDTAERIGEVYMVVVWAGVDADSRRCAAAVEQFRRQNPRVGIIGVNIDDTVEQAVAAARALELDWPQCHDGMGWGGEFVRTWGVRRIPCVFVIDRAGKLAGCANGRSWEALARRAVELPGGSP